MVLAGSMRASATTAPAAVLHLRNGDRLTGTILAETSSHLTLSNKVVGAVLIPLKDISRREGVMTNAPPPTVRPPQAAPSSVAPPGPLLTPEDEKELETLKGLYVTGRISASEYHRQRSIRISKARDAAQRTQRGNQPSPSVKRPAGAIARSGAPVRVPAKKRPPKQGLKGEVRMGSNLGFSEKRRQLYSGRLKLHYVRSPVRTSADYLATYGKTDGAVSANRMDGSMKTDLDVGKGLYLYVLAGAGYDEIRKIDWRYEVGPGTGYQLFNLTNFVMRIEGGFHYQAHYFEDDREQEAYSQRLAQYLKWIFARNLTFDEKAEYLPQLDTSGEFKIRVEANLRYFLRRNLSLNLTVINLYDTVTAQGVGKNDLQLRSSVGVKF
jgi:hypothetical protein